MATDDAGYFLLPSFLWQGRRSALDDLEAWLNRELWWVTEGAPGRDRLVAGPRVCFHVSKPRTGAAGKGAGVVAKARVKSAASFPLGEATQAGLPTQLSYGTPYGIALDEIVWLPNGVRITRGVCATLDAYQGKPLSGHWRWLCQPFIRELTARDYAILTGGTRVGIPTQRPR